MSTLTHRGPIGPQPRTALAFLIAPGVASLAGGLVASVACLCAQPIEWSVLVVGPVLFAFFFALVGYPTAAVLGIPVYLALPERARRVFAVVVPLAGVIAAAPWILVVQPWQARTTEPAFLLIPFALGCVGGIAFLFVRLPRANAVETTWVRGESLDAV